MALNPDFGRRAREALRKWEDSHDPRRMSFREIGERVAALVGREKAFSHAAARAWIMDGQEPGTLALTEALASVLEVDSDWLAWGKTEAPVTEEQSDDDLPPEAFEELA